MSDGETVGEHLRRKLLKVAASAQGESGKENLSPNVNTSPPRGGAFSGYTQSNAIDEASTNNLAISNALINTAVPTVLSAGKRRGISGEPRSFAKPSIASSKIQNLLSARKTCVLPASGKLSLLNSSSAGKFSYEKLEDGGYYQGFCGAPQGAALCPQKSEFCEINQVLPNDRVPTEGLPCFENVYVEPSLAGLANRSRPPCLLPWEQSGETRPVDSPSQTSLNRLNPLSDQSSPATPANGAFKSGFPRAPLDLPSNSNALQGQTNSNGLGSNFPRVLRNRRSAAGAGGRKLRRRHSLCAALSPMLWPQQLEDREADVSADQSADEDDEDSEFG